MANNTAGTAGNDSITHIVEPVVAQAGLFLEDVKLVKAGKYTSVRITVDLIDGPGGVDSSALADVTRAISAELDEKDPIAGAYTLEVSTPGADRKLTEPRHFSRSVGRLADFVLVDGTAFQARIESVSDGKVSLRVEDGPKNLESEKVVPIEEINSAKVVVELRKMKQESEGD